MKIIKPQQLVFLKNAYKLGNDCYLGISAIAGCYLSKTNHFVTESEIWQTWKDSPVSMPYLDIPVIKQFAEFVLIGNADIGSQVKSLDVEIKVGNILRQWRVFGSGEYLKSNSFRKMSMDHTNTWGGDGNIDNPLGTGYKIGSIPPSVIERHGDKLYERYPLTSPSPIPLDFRERKKYIDEVAKIMSSKKYLETSYPGYPDELDLRHFQISAPSQWSKEHIWDFDTNFSLIGFGGNKKSISGKFANVTSRLFVWEKKDIKIKEIPLLFQTIWFVPDHNLAFMVFTGSIKLEKHILEEPFESLMLALDSVTNPKPLDYFLSIYNKRVNSKTSLEYLLDYDLMTGAKSLNVITSKENHPYSLKYENKPMDEEEVKRYFDDINKSIKNNVLNDKDKEFKLLLKNRIKSINFVDILDTTEDLVIENKNFKAIKDNLIEVKDKKFNHCSFNEINFKEMKFENCFFNQCSFFECHFNDLEFQKLNLKKSDFYNCKFNNVKYIDSELSDCLIEKSIFKLVKISNFKCVNSKFTFSFFKNCDFEQSELEENVFHNSSLENVKFNNTLLSIISFNETKLSKVTFLDSSLNNISTIENKWDSCSFNKCQLNCFSAGAKVIFNKMIFSDCYLEKIGLGNSIAPYVELNYCSVKEINFNKTDLSYSKFDSSDMMVSIFKDAKLYKSKWKNTSAQQSIFYNATLNGASFKNCNFVGSNFAMAFIDEKTQYDGSLLDNIIWIPKRSNNKGLNKK